ncbi:FAD-dependent oxidoreductase [Nocardioides sp. SOB77]|uniref:ferredoxin--NADP(+) reductase n=1 Tax=Nocardioides oceani TaxID=3058369 RepID=A0ABT8FLL0_9ACTN|nr:FAD-dependent oxidoreductase [Nocardioides oceani]MDN4175405.1 FAD-dependent oxidoreductase [Nocardioides oceani]
MPYVVTQSCCADASCVVACPVNCIHPAPGEPGFATAEMLYVDPRSCVGCGACTTACPVGAVVPDTALTPEQEPFRELNAAYYDAFPHADRAPLALVPPQRRLQRPRPVRVAVVGAGPAGLYTADELLTHPEVTVDVLDRLPTPYGLLRAGVAPDHQHTKEAERLFRAIEEQPGFRYLLGVEVGRDVTSAELAERYDAVVWTVGASADRRLGVPGEDLAGSASATALVGWYNGHPDHRDLVVDLAHERVVVIGNGNVALDVARVLTADADELARTDVADHALVALRDSAVRELVVVGRRGPGQASFTTPELVGLAGLARSGAVDVVVDLGGAAPEELAGDDLRTRVLRELAGRTPDPTRRRIVLRFLASPTRLLGTDRVAGVELVRNELVPDAAGVPRAKATDETEVLEAGMVLRSVGYRGVPVDGLPHDPVSGTVPNEQGRVEPGTYVAGWVKRGPTGFLGTNKSCAQETVGTLLDDLDSGLLEERTTRAGDLRRLLDARGVHVVDLAGWRAIDREERRRGEAAGRPRVKLTDPDEMLETVRSAGRRGRRRLSASSR